MKSRPPLSQKLIYEREMLALGAEYIAGADEVGRGPLAGPVVCAAVILPLEKDRLIEGIDDSKKLSAAARERLAALICERIVASLQKRLKTRDIELEVRPAALEKLVDEGYSEEFGARPLKRVVRRRIEDRLSEEILQGRVGGGSVVAVDVENGEFVFRTV